GEIRAVPREERLVVRVVCDRELRERRLVRFHRFTDLTASPGGRDHPPGVKSQETRAASSTSPRSTARVIASLRLVTPSLRYTEIACVFTVFRDTYRASPISRKERCVARNGSRRSSAGVSPAAAPSPRNGMP